MKEDDLEAWLTRLNAALATRDEAMAELVTGCLGTGPQPRPQ